jgi:hypothetical protein
MHETNQARSEKPLAASFTTQHERPFVNFSALCKEVLIVSPRKGAEIIKEEWFPAGIQLGARCRRWSRSEVVAAMTARAPRLKGQEEPAQLAVARGRKAKAAV